MLHNSPPGQLVLGIDAKLITIVAILQTFPHPRQHLLRHLSLKAATSAVMENMETGDELEGGSMGLYGIGSTTSSVQYNTPRSWLHPSRLMIAKHIRTCGQLMFRSLSGITGIPGRSHCAGLPIRHRWTHYELDGVKQLPSPSRPAGRPGPVQTA